MHEADIARRDPSARSRGRGSAGPAAASAEARRAARRGEAANPIGDAADGAALDRCWLCARPLGRRIEWHHPRPRSRGGRLTVPVHPICHRALHATFTNVELARFEGERQPPAERPEMQDFLGWIAGKPPDFHAPTRSRRR